LFPYGELGRENNSRVPRNMLNGCIGRYRSNPSCWRHKNKTTPLSSVKYPRNLRRFNRQKCYNLMRNYHQGRGEQQKTTVPAPRIHRGTYFFILNTNYCVRVCFFWRSSIVLGHRGTDTGVPVRVGTLIDFFILTECLTTFYFYKVYGLCSRT
jgi:hypothetical protein